MRHFFSFLFFLAAGLTVTHTALADSGQSRFPNKLSVDSVNPKADAVFLEKMRHHLDSIRLREHRPTVALVLGGGGAKGATEIGVFRLLEEVGMPIDVICGTSIGSLMGGLFSMGYDSHYIDSLMRNQDWGITLSDKVDQTYVPFLRKKHKAKYLLSLPFHYENDVLQQRLSEQEKYTLTEGNSINPLSSSLPSGYVYGLNVNNLLSSLTVGYQDSLDFSRLPIPFFCVATDVVSMKAKFWSAGQLKTAMRSSMSIPAMFTPVRTQGMVLVDGGTRNNFPVDLAKSMGADYIIGVDLLNDSPKYSQINNIGNLLGQFVTMLSNDSYGETISECDIYIKPDVSGYNSLSFSPQAIDTLISRGYRAAVSHKNEIDSLKNIVGGRSPHPVPHPGTDISKRGVLVDAIIFEGMRDYESKILQKMIGLKVGTVLNSAQIQRAVSIIQSSEVVETVTYSLLGKGEPYRLVFRCTKTPVHELSVGARLDTEVWAEIALHLGIGTRKLSGAKIEFDASLGLSQKIKAHFMLDYPEIPTINAEVSANFVNGNMICLPGAGIDWLKFNAGYISHQEKIYLSSTKWTRGDIQVGLQNSNYRLRDNFVGSQYLGLDSLTQYRGNYLGLFLKGNTYTFDDHYFPTKGIHLSYGYNMDFSKSGVKGFTPIHSLFLDLKGVVPMGERVTLIPDFHLRNVFDRQNQDYDDSFRPISAYSLSHRNFIGGTVVGRYLERQVPFVGMTDVAVCYMENPENIGKLAGVYNMPLDHIAVLNVEMRVNLLKNLYMSALGGYAHMAPTFDGLFGYHKSSNGHSAFRDLFGAGVQVSYKTIGGPISARLQWCNRATNLRDNISFYISAGFDF